MRKTTGMRLQREFLQTLIAKGRVEGAKRYSKGDAAFKTLRALRVTNRLKEWHDNRWGFFSIPDFMIVPEVLAVEGLSDPADKARLLYFAVGTDHSVQSQRHYPLFRRAYDADPRNVHPAHIAQMTQERALDHFLMHFCMSMPLVVRDMHTSAQILESRYCADPRRIFEKVSCVHDAIAVLGENPETKMPGYGPQLAKLYIKNCVALNLIDLANGEEAQPKVDRHMKRICIASGILDLKPGEYHATALDQVIGEGWLPLLQAGLVDGAWLNNVVWNIGSKRCVKQDKRYCWGCPLYDTFCQRLPATFDLSNGTYTVGKDVRKPLGDEDQLSLINIVTDKRTPLIIEAQSSYKPGTDRRYLGGNPDQLQMHI